MRRFSKIFYWPFQGGTSFVDLIFFFCLVFVMPLFASVYLCLMVTCWERAGLLALVCGVKMWVCHSPLVSCVKCGTWWYRFLIFAPLLTLIFKFFTSIFWIETFSFLWCIYFTAYLFARECSNVGDFSKRNKCLSAYQHWNKAVNIIHFVKTLNEIAENHCWCQIWLNSEYEQEVLQTQTADQPTSLCESDKEHRQP